MSVLTSTNPAKGFEKVGEVTVSTEADVKAAIAAARKAQAAWQELGVKRRVAIIRKFADIAEKRAEEAAQLISNEMGKPITDARGEAGDFPDEVRWIVDNAPDVLADKIVSEDDDGQVVETREPYGDGKVGAMLVDQDIDFISFVGSSKVGRELYKKAAEKFINVRLEMGGSSAGIVFADVDDLDATLDDVVGNRFYNTGQVCSALKRLMVEESVYDEVVQKLKEKVSTLEIQSPETGKSVISSLVAERQVAPILSQIDRSVESGAKVLVGGKRAEDFDGAYIQPTLITDVSVDMPVWFEEVFGPVLPVMKFKNEVEAINLANGTEYGLNAFVYSGDPERVERVAKQLKAGAIETNCVSHGYAPNVSVGGYKQSGIGRTGGVAGLLTGTQIKVITRKKK